MLLHGPSLNTTGVYVMPVSVDGPVCEYQECPSESDPLGCYGNEAGRECSGRGICNYDTGLCECFPSFYVTRCQHQSLYE